MSNSLLTKEQWARMTERNLLLLAEKLEREMAEIDRGLSINFGGARLNIKPRFNEEYPDKWRHEKTCLGCGSSTQPCCGH